MLFKQYETEEETDKERRLIHRRRDRYIHSTQRPTKSPGGEGLETGGDRRRQEETEERCMHK